MNLEEITAEIAALEKRLELLRAAEAALIALGCSAPPIDGLKNLAETIANSKWLEPVTYLKSEGPPKSLAAAIRELLAKEGPMTKAGIDKALSKEEWSLGKGSVSGALQAMKVRGTVARTKTGKWTLK